MTPSRIRLPSAGPETPSAPTTVAGIRRCWTTGDRIWTNSGSVIFAGKDVATEVRQGSEHILQTGEIS